MINNARGTLEMSLAMTILGTIGWFVLQSGQPSINVVFWRCVFAAPTLCIICAALGLFRHTLTLRVVGIAMLGGAAIVTNWFLLFSAYSRVSIAIATVVYNTQPFMLVAFGAALFSERLTTRKLLWLALAFAGMVLIVWAKPDADVASTRYFSGIAMALGAAFFWAIAAIITKKLTGTPPHLIALIQVTVGVLMLAPFVSFALQPIDARSWGMLATIGIVHTGLTYILMYGAIQKLPTYLQGTLSFIYPVVAIAVDVVGFGHPLQLAQVLGAASILLAVAGMNRAAANRLA
jgi:drug/metabolite transporter (DMT)-like permease